jgi:hypothetical protein
LRYVTACNQCDTIISFNHTINMYVTACIIYLNITASFYRSGNIYIIACIPNRNITIVNFNLSINI